MKATLIAPKKATNLLESSGLPRNGLVALYDPYRDTYGRNVVSTGDPWYTATGLTVTNDQPDSAGGTTGQLWMETATTGGHYRFAVAGQTCVAGSKYVFSVDVKPAGRTQVRMYNWHNDATKGYTAYSLEGSGSVLTNYAGNTGHVGTIVALGNGWYRLTHTFTADTTADYRFWLMGYSSDINYAGDANKGFYVSMWQKYFDKLFPYSPPAGAPGTLQTSLDYSGNGNHLTLGATTSASTDDPAFTGTAWSFDGGDFLTRTAIPASTMPFPSLAIVFKTPASWANGALFSTQGLNGSGFGIRGNGNGKLLLNVKPSAGNSYYFIMNSVSANTWHSVVFAHGPAPMLALDGVVKSSYTVAEGSPLVAISEHSSLEIGKGQVGMASVTYCTSEIGLVALYGRTLILAEITRSYLYLKGLMASRGVTLA